MRRFHVVDVDQSRATLRVDAGCTDFHHGIKSRFSMSRQPESPANNSAQEKTRTKVRYNQSQQRDMSDIYYLVRPRYYACHWRKLKIEALRLWIQQVTQAIAMRRAQSVLVHQSTNRRPHIPQARVGPRTPLVQPKHLDG